MTNKDNTEHDFAGALMMVLSQLDFGDCVELDEHDQRNQIEAIKAALRIAQRLQEVSSNLTMCIAGLATCQPSFN